MHVLPKTWSRKNPCLMLTVEKDLFMVFMPMLNAAEHIVAMQNQRKQSNKQTMKSWGDSNKIWTKQCSWKVGVRAFTKRWNVKTVFP